MFASAHSKASYYPDLQLLGNPNFGLSSKVLHMLHSYLFICICDYFYAVWISKPSQHPCYQLLTLVSNCLVLNIQQGIQPCIKLLNSGFREFCLISVGSLVHLQYLETEIMFYFENHQDYGFWKYPMQAGAPIMHQNVGVTLGKEGKRSYIRNNQKREGGDSLF